ncbi:MAG: glycosyltransferase [Candidatus Peribacteraceae bacterium]|nr:glycosyltransferase [Candidatus Peribacteraceae bacterium]
MQPYQITYFGTYEANYPRNRLYIRQLRDQGICVNTCHVSPWKNIPYKEQILKKRLRLLRLFLRILRGYAVLGWKLSTQHRKTDEIMVGYIGQLDVLFVWPFARIMRKKLSFNALISLHDTLVSDRKIFKPRTLRAKVIWLLDWLAFHAADEVIMDTQAHKEFLAKEFGLPGQKIVVTPVDAEAIFRPLPVKKTPREMAYFRVLFYGKFIPLQGIDTILRAMKLLEREKDIRLQLVGTGQLYNDMRLLAQELELTAIDWIQWVPYEKLPTYINKADLCLGIFGTSEKAARVVPSKVWQCLRCGKHVITRTMSLAETHPLFGQVTYIEPNPRALAEAILDYKRHYA